MSRAIWSLSLAASLWLGALAADAQTRCPAEATVRSLTSTVATQLSFRNGARSERQIYWIDFNGRRVHYASLQPRQDHAINTFIGHPWVVTDGAGNCLAVYFPDAQPRHIALSE